MFPANFDDGEQEASAGSLDGLVENGALDSDRYEEALKEIGSLDDAPLTKDPQ